MDYAAAIRDRLPAAWRGSDFSALLSDLESYLSPEDVEGVIAAYEFSARAHEGQQRLSGEAYISHPVAVAKILASLHLDSGSIKAAL
ncbi:MAG: HD domain-containing protein, partial [Gammaproteobacteria bacterium]|nr:HD domain-containing protein [Gammaproteobacteria bacterium]